MRKYFIVDGRHLLHRAAYAFPDFSARGSFTGAAFGFLAILLKAHRDYGGKVVVCWEGKKNFRKKLFPDYKPPPTDPAVIRFKKDLEKQEAILVQILRTTKAIRSIQVEIRL